LAKVRISRQNAHNEAETGGASQSGTSKKHDAQKLRNNKPTAKSGDAKALSSSKSTRKGTAIPHPIATNSCYTVTIARKLQYPDQMTNVLLRNFVLISLIRSSVSMKCMYRQSVTATKCHITK